MSEIIWSAWSGLSLNQQRQLAEGVWLSHLGPSWNNKDRLGRLLMLEVSSLAQHVTHVLNPVPRPIGFILIPSTKRAYIEISGETKLWGWCSNAYFALNFWQASQQQCCWHVCQISKQLVLSLERYYQVVWLGDEVNILYDSNGVLC